MRSTFSFLLKLAIGLLVFLSFGLCLSCLSVMEQRMGLVGKTNRLPNSQPPVSIPYIGQNLSGVTWSQATETLFAITNSPQAVFELTSEGQVLRRMDLQGFSDTEDIAHIEGDLFALVEERRGMIRLLRITDETTVIRAADSPEIDLGSRHEDNKGFESLFFDPVTRSLLTMRELPPFDLISIPLDAAGQPGTIRRERLALDVDDVAALTRDKTGTLLILSEASSCLIRTNADGRELSRIRLEAGILPFAPEGLTFGAKGDLFIVGEPDILVHSCL
jgi:uncharacterized protein YjiK